VQTGILAKQKLPSLSLSQIKLPVPVLLYLLAVVIPVQFHLGPLSLNGLRLLLLVLIIPLTIRLLIGKYGRLFWTDLLFLLHIFWATVALAVNNPDRVVENMGSTSIEFIGAYVLGRAYIRDAESFGALIRALILIVLATLPLAFYEAKTGDPILVELIRSVPSLQSVNIVHNDPRMGLERVQAVFAHPIHYGLFSSVAFSLCFVGFKGLFNTPLRYLLSALIGLGVFLSLSSGALLSIVLQLGLIFWAWIMSPVKHKWLVLLAVGIVLYIAVDLMSNRTPIRVFMTYATFSPHNAYWRSIIFEWGMKNVWANPIFGLGHNDWIRPHYMHSGSMDNFWLVMATRYGIPGFLFLGAGYMLALWQIGRRNLNGNPTLLQFRRAWMFTFSGLSFTLTTVHIWASIYSFVFFIFGAGFWFITAKTQEAASTDPTEPARNQGPLYHRSDLAPKSSRKTAEPTATVRPAPSPAADHRSRAPESRSDAGSKPRYSRFSGPPGKKPM